jgi:K+-transporting ATPase KdpF subunit
MLWSRWNNLSYSFLRNLYTDESQFYEFFTLTCRIFFHLLKEWQYAIRKKLVFKSVFCLENFMDFVIAGLIASALLVYLTYTMFNPDKFK